MRIIKNSNNTFTIKADNWTLTANLLEVERMMNKCFNVTVLKEAK